MSSVRDDIIDCVKFARSMGVYDGTCVVLTEFMLRAVCKDAGLEYLPDDQGRMNVGTFTFYLREGLDKALVVSPKHLAGALE